MPAPHELPTERPDPAQSVVVSERRQLMGIAYRLLGSIADAEDAVQEAYARWFAMSLDARRDIDSPGAWLTRVTTRLCLDQLGSARARRERYVGEWIPEPLPDRSEWRVGTSAADAADPVDRVTLDESINMAFLVVLHSMPPPERVALVLHDVFRYSFADVAEILGRTPAACRQLASVARGRLRSLAASPEAEGHASTVRAVKLAWDAKDIEGLVDLLHPEAVAAADGGGVVRAAVAPIRGGRSIAQHLVGEVAAGAGLVLLERTVNGQPGLVAQLDTVTVAVFAFDVAGGRVRRVWAVRNPEKLRQWVCS